MVPYWLKFQLCYQNVMVSHENFDWILTHTETSIGLKIDEKLISLLAKS